MNHNIFCLWSIKWSHLIINPEKYDKLLAIHPATQDGYIHVVGGIIRDSDGCIYLQQNAKLNEFYVPWGKVEQWETLDQALARELKEEVDIDIIQSQYLWCIKLITHWVKRCLHFFGIVEYTGTVKNKENHKCDNYRVEILDSDNELGFAVKVDSTITDDVQDILHSFLEIHVIKNILPIVDMSILQDALFENYNTKALDQAAHYYLYVDLSQKKYFFQV